MNKSVKYSWALLLQFTIATSVYAADFDWLKSLSLQASADKSGFTATLAARFRLGDARINTVISNVGGNQATAYMVLRLAEISRQPVTTVVSTYQANKRKGWGVVAKKLGIKPGSAAFHALKRGHDLGTVRISNTSKPSSQTRKANNHTGSKDKKKNHKKH